MHCTVIVTIVLFLQWQKGNSSPVIEYDKGVRYEEYIVEHEISAAQARNSALTIDYKSIDTPAGCQTCTPKEKQYCLGRDLINDHCCCDKRYHEVLPFVPHTCYLGTQICKTIAPDCAEYSRLRDCCCLKFVLQKWQLKSDAVVPTLALFMLLVFSFVNIFV